MINIVRSLYIARCLLFTSNPECIQIAYDDATIMIQKIKDMIEPKMPQEIIDTFTFDSEIELINDKWLCKDSIDYGLALLELYCLKCPTIAIFIHSDGRSHCIGNNIIVNTTNGKYLLTDNINDKFETADCTVRGIFLKIQRQRRDKKRPRKKRKIEHHTLMEKGVEKGNI